MLRKCQWSSSPAMQAAINAAELASPRLPIKPTKDKRLTDLEQLHTMARAALQDASNAELAGYIAKQSAEKLMRELQVRIEVLKIDLGIAIEDETDPHEEGGI